LSPSCHLIDLLPPVCVRDRLNLDLVRQLEDSSISVNIYINAINIQVRRYGRNENIIAKWFVYDNKR